MLQRLDLHPTPHSSLQVDHVAALRSLVGALVMAMSTAFGAEVAVFQTAAKYSDWQGCNFAVHACARKTMNGKTDPPGLSLSSESNRSIRQGIECYY